MALYVGNTKYKVMSGGSPASFVVEDALPYDAEIEYLEATGTQYIETGVTPTSTSEFTVDAIFTSTQRDNTFISASTNWNFAQWTIFYASSRAYFAVTNKSVTLETLRYIYKIVGATWYIDDVEKVTASWNNAFVNTTVKIFCHGSISRFTTGRIYNATFKDSNVLIKDFIPVRVSNVGYLYDKVSGQLFGNAGSGDFVLGPDV